MTKIGKLRQILNLKTMLLPKPKQLQLLRSEATADEESVLTEEQADSHEPDWYIQAQLKSQERGETSDEEVHSQDLTQNIKRMSLQKKILKHQMIKNHLLLMEMRRRYTFSSSS